MTTRICKICGKKYKVCPSCEEVRTFAPWRTLVCSVEHYQVFTILSEHICTKDSKQAAQSLHRLHLTKDEMIKFTPAVQKSITDIYAAAKSEAKK